PRDAIERTYNSVFSWRSGMFLAAMVGMILAFAILSFDRMSGITAEERREVGILKATGWTTGDVLLLKAFEGLVISINSFVIGIILAYLHVFYLGATVLKPILIGWSVLYPDFALIPYIDLNQILLIFFISVVPFMAAIIIPSWKTAVTDPDVALRGI
ncbi:MAG: FtsX-like permease family protein, partial [Euryarchaeota archaeon]|nr:FtsX-like permease family protein [Euryarchaeota archaeon]